MLKKYFALSEQGVRDMKKGIVSSIFAVLSLMLPIGILTMYLMQQLMPLFGIEVRSFGLGYYVPLCAILLFLIFITHFIQYRCTYVSAYKESARRRIQLAETLRTLPLSFFNRHDLSDLTTTIMTDCNDLERIFSYTLPQLVGTSFVLIIVCGVLFLINWHMALAIAWVLPMALCMVCIGKKLQDCLNRKKTMAKLAVSDGIQEYLETIRDLRANNQTKNYLNTLEQKLHQAVKSSVRYELVTDTLLSCAQMVLRLGFATTVLVGVRLFLQNQISLLSYLLFLITASRIYDPLSGVMMQIGEVFNASIQIERMKAMEQAPAQNGNKQCDNKGYDICFAHICFWYQEGNVVLDDVTFTAKQGQITALVGPSGGGKSTIAKLAARFWDAQKGTITMGGVDISTVEPETLLQNFSIVFQDVVLFNDTIMGNIRVGRKEATDDEVIAAARAAQCDAFIQKLPQGYDTLVGENGATLSGGERQRISIARALLKNAPIVLLDEATASLDVENESCLQTALSTLLKGKTVLVIAHRMRTIMGADHVIVLSNGQVVEEGSPIQLMNQEGLFRHMVELQQHNAHWKIHA